eukprot:gene3890-7763_t
MLSKAAVRLRATAGTSGGKPWDFGFGSSSYAVFKTPEQKLDIQNKEINNGRLAMLGIMALLTHDVAKPAGEGLFTLHHF